MRNLDYKVEVEKITAFIQKQLQGAGKEHLIVGISGGIDSAVTVALSKIAVGKDNVHGFLLPYRKSSSKSLEHGKLVAEHLGIKYEVIEISDMVDAYFDKYEPEADSLRRGNRMARERMCILFDQSAKYDGLVAGTGNKSELLTGYLTQHGDGACAFEPIGHLYKTEVFELARYLGLPEIVINKSPSADLWEDQTDEDEMGIRYAELDRILYHLYELDNQVLTLLAKGARMRDINLVVNLYKKSEFKRSLPPVIELEL